MAEIGSWIHIKHIRFVQVWGMGDPTWMGYVGAGTHFTSADQGFQCPGPGDLPVPRNM